MKIGALIHFVKFLSREVALYLYKSTIRTCMEYCCHIWDGAPSCYLELLDNLQKRMCRTVGPSCAASLKCGKLKSFLYSYYFSTYIQNWLNWSHFLFLQGGPLVILIDCIIFLSAFLDVTSMSMSTVSFLTKLDPGLLYLQNGFL